MTKSSRPGPKPEVVKIEGDWQDGVKKALQKERPKSGWPNPSKTGKQKK
jgi:hypothetical protein